MATNIQLELAFKEAQKEIQTLRAEVDALKSTSVAAVLDEVKVLRDALDKTFRAIGSGTEWHHAVRNSTEINTTELAVSINTAAPAPVSAVPTAADWQNISQELFGKPLPTMDEIQKMIHKDAVTTAIGEGQ